MRPHHPDCLWGDHPDDTNCYNSKRPMHDPDAVPLPRPPASAAVWAELGFEYVDLGSGRGELRLPANPVLKPFKIELDVRAFGVEHRHYGPIAMLKVMLPPRPRRIRSGFYDPTDDDEIVLELPVDSIRLAPKETV